MYVNIMDHAADTSNSCAMEVLLVDDSHLFYPQVPYFRFHTDSSIGKG